MNKDKKELTSAFTHLGGAVFGAVAMILLLNVAIESANPMGILAFVIFGLSMIFLYSTSTIYHLIDKSRTKVKLIMRKLDHIMIFFLIAGTYTPVCLLVLKNSAGYKMLGLVWLVAFVGVFIKIFWINAPSWVSAGLYIAMGWLAVLILKPLVNKMPHGGMMWLLMGGIMYTIGGIIYAFKKPKLKSAYFGFHELFHCFVLAGTFCHFMMMYLYVV